MAETNVLQVMFAAMWKLTEDNASARRMLIACAEEYNRRMAEINRKS